MIAAAQINLVHDLCWLFGAMAVIALLGAIYIISKSRS